VETALGVIVAAGVALALIRQFARPVESSKGATWIHDLLFGASAGAFAFFGVNLYLASDTKDDFLRGMYPLWAFAGAFLGFVLLAASTFMAYRKKRIPSGAFMWGWAAALAGVCGVLLWFASDSESLNWI
jgi:hypothetical protein